MTPINPQSDIGPAEKPEELTGTSRSNSKWTPTQQSFEKLLAAFNSKPNEAGKIYELVRLKLLRYFERNGIADADRYVDVTLDRVMRRLDEGELIANIRAFIYVVASYVRMEAWNDQEKTRKAEDEMIKDTEPKQGQDVHESPRQLCLDQCLNELPVETRMLILDYFREEGSAKIKLRSQLATGLGIGRNALRIRVHRIRVTLETCVKACASELA